MVIKMGIDRRSVCIIIPCLNPDQKLLRLLQQLDEQGYTNVILINDGSAEEFETYFDAARDRFGYAVLRHHVNQGKGRALKTGFNYFLGHYADARGVVCVDADGQHRIADITACAEALLDNPDKLIIGCRDFKSENVPFRSRFGNIVTRNVFSALCGVKVTDTQTGLRAIPTGLLPFFMKTKGERFEYEMNMLIDCKQENIAITEVPIETVYLENNSSSHFNPFLDSMRIYSVFLKFIFSSLSSFVIDILLFTVCTTLLKDVLPVGYILAATVIARAVSSIVNYLINRNIFRYNAKNRYALVKYYTLVILQMLISALSVTALYRILSLLNESVIKIIVDTILFLLSFKIQQNWVFKVKQERTTGDHS